MNYITTDNETWHHLKPFIKENRRNQTLAEKIIWNAVRNKALGFKFRRQHAIHTFIVDFVCLEKKLIIEIDGESHIGKEEYDEERTKILTELGYKVIRFSNEEVIGNGNMVIEKIKFEFGDKT